MLATFLELEIDEDAEADFDDADEISNWARPYVAALQKAKIVEGYDGKFNPKDNITRAEVVTMINRALNRVPAADADPAAKGYENPFTDVSDKKWYFLQIMEGAVKHDEEDFH